MHTSDVKAKLIQVIEVEHLRKEEDATGLPPRWVKSYWDLKGNLLCESDPMLSESLRRNSHQATSTETFRR